MRIIDNDKISLSRRRILIGSAAWAAAGAGAFAFNLHNLAAASLAASASAKNVTDYKALVCVFLFGGNDSGNTLIPYDQNEYNRYLIAREGSTSRPYGITRLRGDLLPLAAASVTDGRQFALPKEMSAFKALYDQGKAAIVANVGLLAYPTTRQQYDNGTVEIPPQLFSHSDQTNFWQAGVPSYATSTGWGGRLADLMSAANASGRISSAITVAGNNFWQIGSSVIPFPLDTDGGAVALFSMEEAAYGNAMRKMLDASRSNLLEQEAVRVYRRSMAGERAVSEALEATTAIDALFPRTPPASVPGPARGWHEDLMGQLAMAARMVASGESLGLKRQVIFIGVGGFDMHNSLQHHAYALQAISDGLNAFYQAMNGLGLGNKVTAFTASDFGRPLQTNGTGSDHGWGGHHFVVGGAVRGGNIYGRVPTMNTGSQDYLGAQGHLIPSMSVDQYAGALARWMGVLDNDLPLVLPNVRRFGALPTLF
jgi:uncharacterized protein (DUF1501 family)